MLSRLRFLKSGSARLLCTTPRITHSPDQYAGRTLAKLSLMSLSLRGAISDALRVRNAPPEFLVQLEQKAEASELIIRNALKKASLTWSIEELAERVNNDIVDIPVHALDYEKLLEAEMLRDELESTLVNLQVLPPEEALIDGVSYNQWSAKGKSEQDFEKKERQSLSSSGATNDMQEFPELRFPSETEMQKRKHYFENSTRIENVLRGFDSALLEVGRVHKVVKGGTTMSMRSLVVVGNRNGIAGFGEGRSESLQGAVERACREAKRNLLSVPLTPTGTIYHRTRGRFVKSEVSIWPAPRGTGIMANNHFSAIFQLFGIKDIGAKLHGPKCLNNATKALFNALSNVTTPETLANVRGLAELPYPMREGSKWKQHRKGRTI